MSVGRARILVTGRDGQLGWELERSLAPLGEVRAVSRRALDLADPDAIRRLMEEFRPTVVANAAAYTAVDRAETDEPLATRVNGEAPGIMAEACARSGALFVHYSTDFVFDGLATRAYREDDVTHPINAYGRSKLAGERAIAAAGRDAIVLRTAWVYANRGGNFVRTIERLASEREEVKVVDDQIGSPTWARHLAEATTAIVARLAEPGRRAAMFSGTATRLFHLVGPDWTSRFEFARAIVELLRAAAPERRWARITPCASAAMPSPAQRPLRAVLDSTSLEQALGIRLPPWRDALAQCLASR